MQQRKRDPGDLLSRPEFFLNSQFDPGADPDPAEVTSPRR
jgi:hypothetical protein